MDGKKETMVRFTRRGISDAERQLYLSNQPGVYKRFESFMTCLLFVCFGGLIPVFLFNRYYPLASHTQLTVVIVWLLIAIGITSRIRKPFARGRNLSAAEVEVVTVETSRAVKRDDPDDYGQAFYIDVMHNEQPATLYLWGQYLDVFEYEHRFPNTAFEFVRFVDNRELIDFRFTGQYFKEEKTLPAFPDKVLRNGGYPKDGDLLEYGIDDVK